MFNKFPFHRILVLFTIFSMSLTACNAAPTLTAPELTSVPESTPVSESIPTPQPTETPTPVPTPTEVAATPTEAGPKEGDKTTVTENGYTYNYKLTNLGISKETGESIFQNVRKFLDSYMFDWPTFNGARIQVNITDKALGERSIYEITHKDFTMADVPSDGIFDPPPVTSLFSHQLKEVTGKTGPTILQEMQGDGMDFEIIISNGTPEGKVEHVTLDTDTGFIVTIVDPETMNLLGGENVSTMPMGDVTVYAEVYDVDSDGNMLGRLAFDRSLNEIDDEVLRNALFLFPASLVEQKDQRKIEQTDFSITLAHKSRWTRADDVTLDLEIERVPQAQP